MILGLKPDRWRRVGDLLPSGRRSKTAYLEYGRCEKYDALVENMIRATIAPLIDRVEALLRIREEFNAEFRLSVVPRVHVGEPSPALAPPLDVIDFCHATRTEIDIDLYVCE